MKYPDQNFKDFVKNCIKVYFQPIINFFIKKSK